MKYLKFLVLVIFSFSLNFLNAKEYTVKRELEANIWNEFLGGLIEQKMRLNYDTSFEHLLWYVDYTMFPIAIVLTDTSRTKLLEYIKKYKEWNLKASKKGIKLDKTLGVIEDMWVYFKYGDEWHSDYNTNIVLNFFSQSTKKHQMTISFEELESSRNEYITYKPQTLYLWWDEVIEFEKSISDNAIKNYMKEIEKKQKIEEEFK